MSADQPGPDALTVSPEEASTNFYWVVGKEQRFNLQTTIRGNPTAPEIKDHMRSVLAALKILVTDYHGEAKQIGRGAEDAKPPAASNGNWEWAQEKGKRYLLLKGKSEPTEVPCPIHEGKVLKRKTNDEGSWLSHKDGERYCSANFRA